MFLFLLKKLGHSLNYVTRDFIIASICIFAPLLYVIIKSLRLYDKLTATVTGLYAEILQTSGADRHHDITFILDCRYRVVESSFLVSVLLEK